jgi:type IV secretory pathway TrbL component
LSIIGIIVAIVLAGLLVWVVEQLPIDATFKRIARVVVVVVLILWLLSAFGLLAGSGIHFR